MTANKSKKVVKGGKRGKKPQKDPFTRKEWYNVMAPAVYKHAATGKTPVNKTSGEKLSSTSLCGRVFETSLADLQGEETLAHYNVSLKALEVRGRNLLCRFNGMKLTTDKLRSLVRKWHTTIEVHADLRTSDGYVLRVFLIAFTRRLYSSAKKTCYAQTAQVRVIRKRMIAMLEAEIAGQTLNDVITKLNADGLCTRIEKDSSRVYPLTNVTVRKVKVVKAPRLDMNAVLALHGGARAAAAAASSAATAAKAEDRGEEVAAAPAAEGAAPVAAAE